jgi:hypothetical protein
MNDRRIQGTDRDDPDANDTVLRVEHDEAELLDRAGAVLWQKIRGEVAWAGEPRPVRSSAQQRAPAQFHGGNDLGRPSRTHTAHAAQMARAHAGETVQAAGGIDQSIGELERVRMSRAAADDQRQQFVVTETVRSQAREFFPWSVVWCDVFHRRYTRFSMPLRTFLLPCMLALVVSACAAPPSKEMDQAQGAIDAARAAGAERYATTEYSAATDALNKANEAVAARDYRLALSYALESSEYAQNAARVGAENQARVRGAVERTTTEISALMATARARLMAAREARVPARLLTEPTASVTAAEAALQKSGEAVAVGDYLSATNALMGVRDTLTAAISAIDAAAGARRPARRQS